MLPKKLSACRSARKTHGNSHFIWRLPFYSMHSTHVYFNNIGSICTDGLRHGNGLSALLLLTRAAKSSAAKTRSMESGLLRKNIVYMILSYMKTCSLKTRDQRHLIVNTPVSGDR